MELPELFHITQKLGAVQTTNDTGDLRVQFRLFFAAGFNTSIESIVVAGSFQSKTGTAGDVDWNWDSAPSLSKSSQAEGDFWTLQLDHDLPTGFYEYKYRVTFSDGSVREAADPCARYSGHESGLSGFVMGGSQPQENAVTALDDRKPLRDLVIYELHAGDFTAEYRGVRAPFDAIQDKLDYLQDLGVNAILFMPWTAWTNKDYDWGYSPFQYFAVEYAYAHDLNKPEEKIAWLKKLITACHERGIHVIMDGVFNHCDMSFPYKQFYLDQSQCPYTAESFGGTFPGLQDLDFNNPCTQAFIRDVCLYWISVFGIDGIRFDNTVNYYVPGDPRGLPDLLDSIEKYANSQGLKNISMTLEHLDMDAADLVTRSAATSYWDNGLYGECFSHLYSGFISSNYLDVLNNSQYVPWPDKVATLYLTNHDHSTVSWQCGSRTLEGSAKWYRTQPHAIALLTSPGTPLIPAGQEFAEDYWIPEDDHGTGRRVRPRPLHWKEVQDGYGSNLQWLYKQLLGIRHGHPALRSGNFYPPSWGSGTQLDQNGFGVDTARGLVIYHRWGPGPTTTTTTTELFYIALNFSDQNQDVTLQFAENGTWADLLAGQTVQVVGYRRSVTLESNWGHVFYKISGA